MPTRKRTTRKRTALPILTPIIHALEHEYGNYKQRSEYAFRLSDNKTLAKAAVHEAWNAFDHFARAFARALKIESRSKRRRKKRPGQSKKIPANDILWLEIERGKRHFVAAQFHCIRHAITSRISIIHSNLMEPIAVGRRDARIEKYRKAFLRREKNWKSGRNGVRPPLDQGSTTVRQAREEIKMIKKSNAKLDNTLDKLDKIYSSLTKRLRGVVVGRID
jgi:hypothetical protein